VINGVINVYKTKGFTSHDVVAKLRGILGQKKIGHTGTLDPEATGVLPVCLGSATKLCDMLTEKKKEYVAKVRLGVVTDTQDMTGTVVKEHPVDISEEALLEALAGFVGSYDQIPPMYSAIKINGKKLYELARAGKEVERKPRRVEIEAITLEEIALPCLTIRVNCSKGTYIRTLCHDLGQRLGCGAAMEELERTRSGQFGLDTALTLEEIEARVKAAGEEEATSRVKPTAAEIASRLGEYLIPVDRMFEAYPALFLLPEAERLIQNGNSFYVNHVRPECLPRTPEEDSPYRVYIGDKVFMGIYEYRKREKRFVPVKMFISQ
jgi:tRNA pseudouridine55 synthase